MSYKHCSVPLTPNTQVLSIASSGTEYSLTLSAGCQYFTFQCRSAAAIRYAFVAGKVATPTDPYATLASGAVFTSPGKYGGPLTTAEGNTGKTPQTIYFGASAGSLVVELVEWLAQ